MILRRTFLLIVSLFIISGTVVAQELPDIPGKIAYIGEDRNVYVYETANTGAVTQLTRDANQTKRYQWPTWSTDGRLAYFCCDFLDASDFALEVHISPDGDSHGKMIYMANDEGFTYAYWSPENCVETELCRDLSVLVTQAGAPFKIELIRDQSTPSSMTIGEGAPYYHTWSFDGTQLAWQRNTVLLSIYDVVGNRLDDLPFRNGSAQVPIWSPVSNELLLAVRDENTGFTDLIVLADSETRVLQSGLQGAMWLGWSPDGRYIAYSVIRDNQGALIVLDALTGEIERINTPLQIISFFWSPDSKKLAYLTPAQVTRQGASLGLLQPQGIQLAWSVMELETGLSRTFEGFTPTSEMFYLINFFDQFAPSHSLWSPDSRYLVFSEVVNGIQNRVTILDTAQDDTVTYPVADGIIGIWSFN